MSPHIGRMGADEQLKRVTGFAAVVFVLTGFILSLTGSKSLSVLLDVRNLRTTFRTEDGPVDGHQRAFVFACAG